MGRLDLEWLRRAGAAGGTSAAVAVTTRGYSLRPSMSATMLPVREVNPTGSNPDTRLGRGCSTADSSAGGDLHSHSPENRETKRPNGSWSPPSSPVLLLAVLAVFILFCAFMARAILQKPLNVIEVKSSAAHPMHVEISAVRGPAANLRAAFDLRPGSLRTIAFNVPIESELMLEAKLSDGRIIRRSGGLLTHDASVHLRADISESGLIWERR
jgi:hypothetical protein